jgi:hypothetical protein
VGSGQGQGCIAHCGLRRGHGGHVRRQEAARPIPDHPRSQRLRILSRGRGGAPAPLSTALICIEIIEHRAHPTPNSLTAGGCRSKKQVAVADMPLSIVCAIYDV